MINTDQIDREIATAERHLAETAGDQSLCAIGRSGRPFPAVKYHEGAVASLAALRSRLAAGDSLEDALAVARSKLTRLGALAEKSADWEAYLEGGMEVLERITESIRSDSA